MRRSRARGAEHSSTARGVLSTEAAISAPCSVKANGIVGEYLSCRRWSQFATTSLRSARLSGNTKSAGEPPRVAFNLLVQTLGGHVVERGEVGIDHDLLTTNEEDLPGDARSNDECRRFGLLCDAAVFHARINASRGWRVDIATRANAQTS